jgi:uncharacterized membrane protein YhiD involved in acid resistance
MIRATTIAMLVLLCGLLASHTAAAQQPPEPARPQTSTTRTETSTETPDRETQLAELRHAVLRLPVAALLAAALAVRPRRRGTPARKAPVIQTQIILAVVGAIVMLVVGSSLARAFGIVGAAGLVRYRAKIDDPKDAGVMLATLAIGLSCGVGLWILAAFGTTFFLLLLSVLETFEPKATQLFALTIKAKEEMKPSVEKLLSRHRLEFELRGASKEELTYDVHVPMNRKTDRLSEQILQLDPEAAVQWEEKKEKK